MLLLQTSRFGVSWVLCGSFCQHPTCSHSAMLLGWGGSLIPRQLCRPGCCQPKIKPKRCPCSSPGAARRCCSECDCRVSLWKPFRLPDGQAQPYLAVLPEGGALGPFPGAVVGLEGWWRRSCSLPGAQAPGWGLQRGTASVRAGTGCSNKPRRPLQPVERPFRACIAAVLRSCSPGASWRGAGRDRNDAWSLGVLARTAVVRAAFYYDLFCLSVLFLFFFRPWRGC